MNQRVAWALATLLSGLTVADGAEAEILPVCSVPAGVAALPVDDPITQAIVASLSTGSRMAMPGEPFNPGDVMQPGLSNRRLVFVWQSKGRAIAVTEHGGRGYYNPVFAFDVSERGNRVAIVATQNAFPSTACQIARDMIAAPK